jgi:hypothetical protein
MRFLSIFGAAAPLLALTAALPHPQEPGEPDDGFFVSAHVRRFTDRACQNIIEESVYRTPIPRLGTTSFGESHDEQFAGSVMLTYLAPGCTLIEGAAGFPARYGNFQPPLSTAETDICFVQDRVINNGQVQQLNFDKTNIDCVNQNN